MEVIYTAMSTGDSANPFLGVQFSELKSSSGVYLRLTRPYRRGNTTRGELGICHVPLRSRFLDRRGVFATVGTVAPFLREWHRPPAPVREMIFQFFSPRILTRTPGDTCGARQWMKFHPLSRNIAPRTAKWLRHRISRAIGDLSRPASQKRRRKGKESERPYLYTSCIVGVW